MNENNDPQPEVNKGHNERSSETAAERNKQAAGTQRKPYQNDAGDPTNEEPAADEDVTIGQQNQPGLPDPEEKEWSPGSDAA